MSRIGNRVLEVPAGVLINLEKNNYGYIPQDYFEKVTVGPTILNFQFVPE